MNNLGNKDLKINGIICEFNPLHSGHVRLLDFAKAGSTAKANTSAVVCVMSGNFVQRGGAAILDKYTRARHAVLAGADLVLELPVVFSVSAAESFARGAVRILDGYGADALYFGSECGDVGALEACARQVDAAGEGIRANLATGKSYPAAVCEAVKTQEADGDALGKLLEKSNNALAVEYLRQMRQSGSKMQPITLLREDNYNKTDLVGEFASASAIRRALKENNIRGLEHYLPAFAFENLAANGLVAGEIEDGYKRFVHASLQLLNVDYLRIVEGVGEGLENRIIKAARAANFEKMMTLLKTKRFTYARLMRCLTAAVLKITKTVAETAKTSAPVCRVLALREGRENLLNSCGKNVKLLTCAADYKSLNAGQKQIIDIDIAANNLYCSLTGKSGGGDFSRQLQIIPNCTD